MCRLLSSVSLSVVIPHLFEPAFTVCCICRLSGKYLSILNILRTGHVALMYLAGQSQETLLRIHEPSLSRGASQSAVRHHWLSLCTVWLSHSKWPSEQISFITKCACPFYSSHAGFFGKVSHHPGLSAPLQPRFGSLWFLAFPKAKIDVDREVICECDGYTVLEIFNMDGYFLDSHHNTDELTSLYVPICFILNKPMKKPFVTTT